MILEDRRIRMNYWISQLINKPLDRFMNPKLIDTVSHEERTNIKSKHFTLTRLEPLTLIIKKKTISYVIPKISFITLRFPQNFHLRLLIKKNTNKMRKDLLL